MVTHLSIVHTILRPFIEASPGIVLAVIGIPYLAWRKDRWGRGC